MAILALHRLQQSKIMQEPQQSTSFFGMNPFTSTSMFLGCDYKRVSYQINLFNDYLYCSKILFRHAFCYVQGWQMLLNGQREPKNGGNKCKTVKRQVHFSKLATIIFLEKFATLKAPKTITLLAKKCKILEHPPEPI